MRHRISGRKLNRKTSHRLALLKNLAKSLIVHEQIETTLPKAKDLRPFIEKILHSGKSNNLHSRRKVFSYLRDNQLVNKVFDVLAKRYAKRNGGYVRVLKSGNRYGDSAPKAIIELVDRDVAAKGFEDKKRVEEKRKLDDPKTSDTSNIQNPENSSPLNETNKQIDKPKPSLETKTKKIETPSSMKSASIKKEEIKDKSPKK
tara:strand:+ start:3276 stop:3881 length:606 start_codon:yes stop_codon:yes gene_type:complete